MCMQDTRPYRQKQPKQSGEEGKKRKKKGEEALDLCRHHITKELPQ
jgi:hypothetical protein